MTALSRPSKEDHLALPLSKPLSSRRSMMWCPWLCQFVPTGNVWNFSTLQIFWEASHLWGLFCLPVSLSAWLFPITPACPGQYTHRYFQRWVSAIGTFQPELPIPLFVASSLNLWGCWYVWSDYHLLRQSSGGHGWLLPPPLSSWRLRPYRLHSLYGYKVH